MDKNSKSKLESKFNEFYLVKLVKKIPLPPLLNSLLIGLFFYFVYIALAISVNQLSIALLSKMHLVQISWSLCLFVSFLLLQKFHSRFVETVTALNGVIDNDATNYNYNSIAKISKSFKSFLFRLLISIPLIIISGVYFYKGVFPNIPDDFFSVPLLFHYLALFFSGPMLYLLGSVGFWFLLVIILL